VLPPSPLLGNPECLIDVRKKFAEAKNFIYQCAKDDTVVALAKEVQLLQRKSQKSAKSPQPPRESDSSPALLKLREFLPLKVDCDRLVDIYTKNFEKTLRILHVPTFLCSYREFWVTTDRDISKMATFLPQLTAVLTLSLALEGRIAYFDDPSTRTYLELAALDHITAWLEELERKQRVNIATLQVETLILLVRHLRHMPVEKLWTATGALVRSAMSMGLHLNPAQSNEISAFQAELRRRLWITIVEMDLQASMASGMPVMVPDVGFSPMTPANLNDLDFDESISELPISRPLHEWTDSLPQVSLAMGLSQRIKAMTLVKNVVPEMDLTEVVKQGRKLEEALQQIPTCLKWNHVLENHKSPADLLNSVLLDIYTRRPLLCLYRPMLLRDTRDDPSFFEIQRACLESSLIILSYQDYFDPRATDPDALSSNSYWDIFQTHCKNDILWAALCICQYIRSSSRQSTSNGPPDTSQPRPYPLQWSLPQSKVSLIRIVENTLDILIQRIGEIGSDLKGILVLSVVLQSIQARGSTQEKESLMYQGMKKALSACRQNLLPAVAPWNQHTPTLNMPDVPQMVGIEDTSLPALVPSLP
jgi:transcription factor-like protein